MKPIRMLVLAAIAAGAVMTYVAATASADRLCEEKVSDTAACPASQQVIKGAKIVGLDASVILLNGAGQKLQTCESEFLGDVISAGGAAGAVLGSITRLLFKKCQGLCSSAHGLNLPYHFETKASTLQVLFSKAGSSLAVVNEGCLFGTKCAYTLETQPLFLGSANEDNTLTATKISFILSNPTFCTLFPEQEIWDVKYLITLEPKAGEHVTPLYLTSSTS